MRIACIDSSATNRIDLQKLIEKAFHESRESIGHVSFPSIYPTTKEELLVNNAPDIVVYGQGLGPERLLIIAREVEEHFGDEVTQCFFLNRENFTLVNLKRLEKYSNLIFSTDDSSARIVHSIFSINNRSKRKTKGKLVFVSGVKGGVGATSLVSGIAHAAQAIEKTAVVLDLSQKSVFSHYMGNHKTHSSDYSAVVKDNILVDKNFINKCIIESPNGVDVFLPPAGGPEIRELWLRDASRVEIATLIIDSLLEKYDLVLVDKSNAEGLLAYVLCCRADSRLLVTSNDPASIHLLSVEMQEILDLPGNARTKIVLNRLDEKGLGKKELIGILRFQTGGGREDLDLALLGFDKNAKGWVGTGNTFYTESSNLTQNILEEMSLDLLGMLPENIELEDSSIFEKVKKVFRIPDALDKNKPKLIGMEKKISAAIAKPSARPVVKAKVNQEAKQEVKPNKLVKPTKEAKPSRAVKLKEQIAEKPKIEIKKELKIANTEALNAEIKVVPIQKAKEDFLYQPPVRRNK